LNLQKLKIGFGFSVACSEAVHEIDRRMEVSRSLPPGALDGLWRRCATMPTTYSP
jgi:hypothetical protein